MKAVVVRQYGPPEVATLAEVPTPAPAAGEVRVRVHATAVATADSAFRAGKPVYARLFMGPLRPRITTLGGLFAGEIDGVGAGATRFRVGDRVVGFTGPRLGAHAEYVCRPEDSVLMRKPDNLTEAETVAACEGAMTALPFLRDEGRLRRGQAVLVNGASGAVGSAAVQLGKHLGAHVTGVCSTANVDLAKFLGADEVIDYTAADFTETDRTYDVVFDAVGKSSFSRCKSRLRSGGVYLTTVPYLAIFWQTVWTKNRSRRAAIAFTGLRPVATMAEDLDFIVRLAEAGELRPVIDGRFPFDRAADAYRRVDSGHKAGSVLLTTTDG